MSKRKLLSDLTNDQRALLTLTRQRNNADTREQRDRWAVKLMEQLRKEWRNREVCRTASR